MITPARLAPVHRMAAELGQHLPSERATTDAAMLLLHRCGYDPVDVAAGIDAVLRLVAETAEAAASDRPWALALGLGRDIVAGGALAVAATGGTWFA